MCAGAIFHARICARGVRRARSEVGCVRLGDRSLRRIATQSSRGRDRRRARGRVRRMLLSTFFAARRGGARTMIRPHGVGFYAPSGFALDPAAVDRAVTRLTAMWERVTVDPDLPHALAALCRERRRAPRRRACAWRPIRRWTSPSRCAAATAGRDCCRASTSPRSRPRASNGWATATSRRSSSRRSRVPAWSRSRGRW